MTFITVLVEILGMSTCANDWSASAGTLVISTPSTESGPSPGAMMRTVCPWLCRYLAACRTEFVTPLERGRKDSADIKILMLNLYGLEAIQPLIVREWQLNL
jgi:hypothetical protein